MVAMAEDGVSWWRGRHLSRDGPLRPFQPLSRPVSQMRELERDPPSDAPARPGNATRHPSDAPARAGSATRRDKHLSIIGRGRLGYALSAALRDAGYEVD